MTGKSGKGTARQTIRVDETLWEEFGEAAARLNSDRSTLVRDYIGWVLRKPEAKEPRQVPAEEQRQ
jgi:metal-responsive CopG/Arc/MetJ family transcriptional regulator